ncbi:hypothetical protein [Alkalihalobacterium chitinilyticum]|uniref:DUF4352 domain-containing protein n=1 Tax=Alkalihalobacterium chitinilyticum TaxID=2980103 RepID=A0ABT5VJL6_9BACI|nr:hypothetical protein [Alkalihalobacterium chitinilyticum]MDE5415381.1 hypothetical protein [Alkalihalobacterium chitinilyticum]
MTNRPWEIEKIKNNVKYLTNGAIVLTDEEAELCQSLLEKDGEDIKAIVEATYHLEWENKDYEGLLVFSDYRVLFFSRIDSGETELDYMETYEYPFISNVTTKDETSLNPQLTFTFKAPRKEMVVYRNIDRTKMDTIVSMMNHYSSNRKLKDYKKSKSSGWAVKVVGGILAGLFILGLIGFFVEDEVAEESHEHVFGEFEDWEESALKVSINENQIDVEDLIEYKISEAYFTNIIEPPNYNKDYPTIFQLKPEDNTLYYVIEMKAVNISDQTIDPIMDIPILFTLIEDGFYEFFTTPLYLNTDLSDFAFDKKLLPEEEAHKYLYFEVPKKLQDNENRIDLRVNHYYDYKGQLINLR